jgi:hypothetical protein
MVLISLTGFNLLLLSGVPCMLFICSLYEFGPLLLTKIDFDICPDKCYVDHIELFRSFVEVLKMYIWESKALADWCFARHLSVPLSAIVVGYKRSPEEKQSGHVCCSVAYA